MHEESIMHKTPDYIFDCVTAELLIKSYVR